MTNDTADRMRKLQAERRAKDDRNERIAVLTYLLDRRQKALPARTRYIDEALGAVFSLAIKRTKSRPASEFGDLVKLWERWTAIIKDECRRPEWLEQHSREAEANFDALTNAIVDALGDTRLDRERLHSLAVAVDDTRIAMTKDKSVDPLDADFDEMMADGPGFGLGTDAPISRFRSPRQFEAEIVKLCGGYGSTPKADDGHPAPCFNEAVGFHLLWVLGNAKARGVIGDIVLDRTTRNNLTAFVAAAAGLVDDVIADRPVNAS